MKAKIDSLEHRWAPKYFDEGGHKLWSDGGVINFGPTGGVGGGQTRKNFAARSAAKFFQTRSNARSAPKNLLIWVILTFSKYLDII